MISLQSELISTDPCTGREIWRRPAADAAAVATAVAAARRAFPNWARLPLDERIATCRAFQAVVRARADDFAALIARETGKPLWETRTEVESVVAKVDISVSAHAERTGTREGVAGGVRQVLRHKPHGVLAVLGPYNFPAHLPNGHIVPALIAGNTIVFKPSELTPATGEFMVECWKAAGLPDGVVNVIYGGRETGRSLSRHPDIDGLLFTGSSATGLALARRFLLRPDKILALEMGGNNPIVAWDIHEADLPGAAAIVAQSAYQTSGQRCTCARRLIVKDCQADELLAHLVEIVDRIMVGTPFEDPQPFMGPVIDNCAAERIIDSAAELTRRGAAIIRPVERTVMDRPFLTPGILDVTAVDQRPDDEYFGPLLQVIRVRTFEEALAEAGRTRFGLAASLIGGDQALYDRFWTELRSGVVNWNRPTGGASSALPFGGAGLSGNHRPSGYYAADYCAWPVASLASDRPVLGAQTGLLAAVPARRILKLRIGQTA